MTTRKLLWGLLLVLLLAVLGAGVGAWIAQLNDNGPPPASQVAACKEGMRGAYQEALVQGTVATQPPECQGLSKETLERLLGEVLDEEMAR